MSMMVPLCRIFETQLKKKWFPQAEKEYGVKVITVICNIVRSVRSHRVKMNRYLFAASAFCFKWVEKGQKYVALADEKERTMICFCFTLHICSFGHFSPLRIHSFKYFFQLSIWGDLYLRMQYYKKHKTTYYYWLLIIHHAYSFSFFNHKLFKVFSRIEIIWNVYKSRKVEKKIITS